MKSGIVVAVLLGLLAFALWFAWHVWTSLEGVEMSIHGWIALILGAGVATALGAGLMWLSFKSHRDGYDDIDRE